MRAPKPIVLAAFISLAALAAQAQTVYKWVDKDGKVHFGDTPPTDRDATAQRVPGGGPSSEEQVPYATQMAAKSSPVVVYTSNDCGELCAKGLDLLTKRGVPFTERNAEKSPDDARALKELAGSFQVPVMTVGSTMVKGFSEERWQSALDGAGYARTRLPGQPGPKTQ
jgi:glutaredoxin